MSEQFAAEGRKCGIQEATQARFALCPAALLVLALLGSSLGQAAEEQKSFFIPKSPTAAAYVLGRLSNKELAEAPRSEFVYVALIQRNGMERKYRVEAMEGLARLRNTTVIAELLKGISDLDRKGDVAEPALRDLATLLIQSKTSDLASQRPDLEKLAVASQTALCRQIGYAAIVMADGSLDPVWREAESNPARLPDLMLSLGLVRDDALRALFYPKVEPLLHRADSPQVRQAAITAIAFVPGHEAETFKTLASLAKSPEDRDAAVASLQRLPRNFWPKAEIEPLFQDLLNYLQGVPVSQRTTSEVTRAFQLATDLAGCLSAEKSIAANRTLRSLGVRIVVVRTLKDQMLYDKTLVVVESGKPVEIILVNDDAMPHNFVVLAPGKLQEIGEAAEKMPPTPDKEGRLYIPDTPNVLQATRLVDPGQQARLSFTAPEAPGEYPFVCTFPGHWRRMSGTLAVVKDVETYLASHPTSGPAKTTAWKLEDLTPDLEKIQPGGGTTAGKELFTQLACRQCHRIADEGAAYGPDLTEVFMRWKGDRASVLQQILEPSKVIEERYRSIIFGLKDGEDVTGMVLKEDAESLTIQTGPADTLIQTLKKSDILSRRPQASSVMPVGLLNTLSKEQILDLLAYLEAGGKIAPHQHSH